MIPDRLLEILRSCEDARTSRFPPTEVFNEGWMLRFVLDAVQILGLQDSALTFLEQATWYSEALLGSPFRPRWRGDKLGEGFTNADAVIGHFEFDPTTNAGVRLTNNAKQFVVVEAKMFSNLSAGTTNARTYDQAVRNVACMAYAISRTGRKIDDFDRLGFFVIAPQLRQRKHRRTNLENCMEAASMRDRLGQRIALYEAELWNGAANLRIWEREYFLPLIDRLVATGSLAVLSWEDCIQAVADKDETTGRQLKAFYDRCLTFCPLAVATTPCPD
jgi:hypothetical protein